MSSSLGSSDKPTTNGRLLLELSFITLPHRRNTEPLCELYGMFSLFRQIIAQAQWDYANGRTTFIYAGGRATVTARSFLFRDDGLELLVERWGLPIDVEAERDKAVKLLEDCQAIRKRKRYAYINEWKRKNRGFSGRAYIKRCDKDGYAT